MSRRAFISCARSDRAAAQRLAAALRAGGKHVDLGGEVATADADRRPPIDACDAFVFLISRDSIGSPACGQELDRAVALDKLVVPAVLHDIDRDRWPAALTEREWIVLADGERYERGLRKLVEALEVDPRSRDEHERITAGTGRWIQAGRDRSLLLRGDELCDAETWLSEQGAHREAPSADEARYIASSRRATVVRQRTRLGAVIAALLVTVTLTVVALLQRDDAARAQRDAISRGLSARAVSIADSDPALAAALSVEAHRADATPEAGDAVQAVLGRLGPHLGRLSGHLDDVTSVAYGGRAGTLVSASEDGTVRIWDVAARSQLGAPLRGHTKAVNAVVRSRDGAPTAPAKAVNGVALSRDGALIASAGDDGRVRLWSVARHRQAGRPLRGLAAGVMSVSFSRDGTTLVSGGKDRTVRLWDVASRRAIGPPLRGHAGAVMAVAFSRDGGTVASAGLDGSVRLWDVATRRPSGSPLLGHAGPVNAVAFSSDGRTVASGGVDGTVRLWHGATQRQIGEPLLPGGGPVPAVVGRGGFMVGAVAFSPDGATLASASTDGALRLWNVATHRRVGPPLAGGGFRAVAFSPDGKTLASGSLDRAVSLWNVARAATTAPPTLGLPRQPYGGALPGGLHDAAFSRDARTRVSAGGDGSLRLWNVTDNAPLGAPLTGHSGDVRGVAVSPGGRLLASAGDDGTVRLWSVATRRQLGAPLRGHRGAVRCLAFSRDGRTLASGGQDQRVRLWDVATRRPIGAPLHGDTSPVYSVAFSPDDRTLASGGGGNRSLRLWDVATHKPIGAPLRGHVGPINRVAFSPDGATLASAGSDKTVGLWKVATQRRRGGPLVGHVSAVQSVAFSPDGKALASGEIDRTVRLWDVAARKPIGPPLTVPGVSVLGLAFRPDGGQLMSADGADNEVRWDSILWRGSDRARRARACAAGRRDLSRAEWREFLPDTPYRRTCSGA